MGMVALLSVLSEGQSTLKALHEMQVDPEWVSLSVFWHFRSTFVNQCPSCDKFTENKINCFLDYFETFKKLFLSFQVFIYYFYDSYEFEHSYKISNEWIDRYFD